MKGKATAFFSWFAVAIMHLLCAGLLPKWGEVKLPSLWQCGWDRHISQACGGSAGMFSFKSLSCALNL